MKLLIPGVHTPQSYLNFWAVAGNRKIVRWHIDVRGVEVVTFDELIMILDVNVYHVTNYKTTHDTEILSNCIFI